MSYHKSNKGSRGPRKNDQIRAPKVMVITEKGENLGVMNTQEALIKAKELNLDLVEVGSNAKPPVCKIMDYSKYIYRQKKKQRKNRQKSKDMKEFKFSPVIETADINTRVRRATEYLEKGHPVRITMYRKGRQSHEQAKKVFNEILTNFSEYSTIEPKAKEEGRNMYLTFIKKNG
jgi:translation initiation factor IF-3